MTEHRVWTLDEIMVMKPGPSFMGYVRGAYDGTYGGLAEIHPGRGCSHLPGTETALIERTLRDLKEHC